MSHHERMIHFYEPLENPRIDNFQCDECFMKCCRSKCVCTKEINGKFFFYFFKEGNTQRKISDDKAADITARNPK